MFFNVPISGDRLPEKTICLTYDDGPGETAGSGLGPRTLELGQYLFAQGVQATFFVIGERARVLADVLISLNEMGHLVANHTESHPSLLKLATSGGNPVNQVLSTDSFIRTLLSNRMTFLRPPYGHWRPEGAWASPVSGALNVDVELAQCIGPILWDIDGSDWQYWMDRKSPEDCAHRYIDLIEHTRRGIVLMHDSSWEETIRNGNQSLQMARILVPELRARGYRFARLDAIPQVASATLVSRRVALRAPNGTHYLSAQHRGGGAILANGSRIADWEEFGLVDLGDNHIALRAPNGQFVSAQQLGGGAVLANGPRMSTCEVFTLFPLSDRHIALRAPDSVHFLSAQQLGGGEILANSPAIDAWEKFTLVNL